MNTRAFARVRAILRKELLHIIRDWQTLMIVIALPVIMMFLYGYALTLDVREVRTIIEDPAGSADSRALARSIDGTTMFDVVATVPAVFDAAPLFKRHNARVIVRIPPGFSRDLRNGGSAAPIQVLIDGTDQNTGTIIRNVSEAVIQNAVLSLLDIEPPSVVTAHVRFLYNPEQKSAYFFVPGLMAVILIMISAMLTSLTVTREKEHGTLEQLLVSPLRSWEIIAGKLLPYVLLAALDGAVILVVGWLFFGVRCAGSLTLLSALTLVYIFTSLSMGLIFSSVAKNQQQAMLMVMPATMLPTIILSGFIFPISSMPWFLRALAHVVPATWYLQVIRGIILKGIGIPELAVPVAAMTAIGCVFFAVAVKNFRMKL